MAAAGQIENAVNLGLTWMSDATGPAQPDTHDQPLRILLQRAKAGDLAAFEQVILLHEQLVYQTALRLLRHVEDAQDASQEVFLRLHKHLRRFDEERRFRAWLYRIVVNVCRDLNDRRGRHMALGLDQASTPREELEATRTSENPFEAASQAQQRRLISQSLACLSEKERAALVLRDLEGLPTSEVAKILGSSEATVRSQISSARLKIRNFRTRQERSRK